MTVEAEEVFFSSKRLRKQMGETSRAKRPPRPIGIIPLQDQDDRRLASTS